MNNESIERLEIQQLIKHKQLDLLYAAIPNSLVASLFGSAIALFMFMDVIDPVRLYLWVALILIISAIRYRHYSKYQIALPGPEEISIWYVRFRIGTLLQAFAVGSGGLLLFAYENSNYQMLLALMIVCMGSFAATTLSPHKPIVITFLIITFFPIVATVYFLHTDVTQYIAWFLSLLTLMLIISAIRINRTITESITLSIEAKYREERIRDYEQRLTMFVQEIPLATIEWQLDLSVYEWNPAAETVFGYTEAESKSVKTEMLMQHQSNDELKEVLTSVINNGEGHQSIHENIKKDGALILCDWINTPLIDAEDNVIGVISLVQDITQRVANEKLKNEFVSIVSHELRTPVTSIKGSLGLLQSGVLDDDPEQSKSMLEIAMSNTNRLNLLINDILDVDKLESGKVDYKFVDYDLCKLINDVVVANQSYAEQYSIQIEKSDMPALCIQYIDPDRLFQVLTNLLSNAIKFSANKQPVTIGLGKTENYWRLSVTNFGEVIPDSEREHMFSKFYQRDSTTTREKGGTGLGLYICQKILKRHNTELQYESTSTEGTTFYFDLEITE